MAIGLTTPEPSANRIESFAERAGDISTADVPLFRFGLRQLFLFVAAICALLAAMASSSGPTALVLLLAVAVVVMHVFATAVGTRLQWRTEQERLRVQAAQPNIGEKYTLLAEQSA